MMSVEDMAALRDAADKLHTMAILLTDEGQGIRQVDPQAVARARELLGDEVDGLTDDDIDRIRAHADAMAHLLMAVLSNEAE